MQGNLVMLKINRVRDGLEDRLGSWKYCKLDTGTFTCIWDMVFSICVIFDIIFSRVSCNIGIADKGLGAICVISACCWFTAMLGAGLWTWTCPVIVAKGFWTKLLLSVLGTDDITGNVKLIPLVLICSTELISKQICKKSSVTLVILTVLSRFVTKFIILNFTHVCSTKTAVHFAKKLRINEQRIWERRAIWYKYLAGWPEMEREAIILNFFNTLILKQIFWKTKTFFKKTVVLFFSWKY